MKRVLKWVVPVDDGWHPIGPGPVALVKVQHDQVYFTTGAVTVWTVENDGDLEPYRPARVYGTGHQVPDDTEHLGSCQDGTLVWHLFRSRGP